MDPEFRLPVWVDADFEVSRRGLPAQIEADLGGCSVLERTLQGIAEAPSLAPPIVVVERRDEERAEALLRGFDARARLFVHDFEDIPERDRLRRGRRWGKDGWRGGIGDAYFVSEGGNPRAWEALYRREQWDAAMVVPGEAALVDPELLEELARHYLDRRWGAPVVLSTAPPGFAGDVFHFSLVSQLAERRTTMHRVFPFELDEPSSDPDLHKASYSFRETVTEARGRVLADSRSGLERVRALWSQVGEGKRPTAEAMIEGLKNHPSLASGSAPEEVHVKQLSPLSDSAWGRVLEVVTLRDDALLTLGSAGPTLAADPRFDPLRDPKWAERVRSAREAGFFGISLSTPGDEIDEAVASELVSSSLDVISIDLECPDADLASRRRLSPSYEARERGLERLVAAAKEHGHPRPFILASVVFDEEAAVVLEPWFERWYPLVDRLLIRGVEGPRGESQPGSMGHFAPPQRFSCQRLQQQLVVDSAGRVPLCGRDPDHEVPVGTLESSSVADLWQSETLEEVRRLHARGRWDEVGHCGDCLSWCRFD